MLVFMSANLGHMYPKDLTSLYCFRAEKNRGGRKSEKDFDQEMVSSCKEVLIFLLFSKSTGCPVLRAKFRGQFCSGSSNIFLNSESSHVGPSFFL